MKYSAILFLFLAGCTLSPMNKAKQAFACKDDGGVYHYSLTLLDGVICNNGKVIYDWKGVILTKDFYPKAEVK